MFIICFCRTKIDFNFRKYRKNCNVGMFRCVLPIENVWFLDESRVFFGIKEQALKGKERPVQ